MLATYIVKLASLIALLVSSGWVGANPSWESVSSFLASLTALALSEIQQLRRLKPHRYNENDLSLYRQILSLFVSHSDCLELLKNHDFGGSFKRKEIAPAREFLAVWNDVQHEFVDRRLEKKSKAMYKALDKFMDLLNESVYLEKGNSEWLSMELSSQPRTSELEERQKQLNVFATKAYKSIQDLIRHGRRTFRDIKDL